MRLDLYLFSTGAASSRAKASLLIREGLVTVNGRVETKPGAQTEGKTVEVIGKGPRYVGRGGLKLERALEVFGISPKDTVCLDVGASTGGFTDCLLQHGAKKVYALDVGHGQLDPSLLCDPRVVSLEGVNARSMTADLFSDEILLAVSDVSFISQKLIYGPLGGILPAGAPFVSLVKPQFEAGKRDVGKNGIVKDPAVHFRVAAELVASSQAAGFGMAGFARSPITGKDGNREYLAYFVRGGDTLVTPQEIKEVIYS